MRVEIEAQPVGPLRILSELPDARLAILEGLNGIGKTLAVRLLRICTTGTPPYRPESPAWASLCSGLGPFRVHVSGLKNGTAIEWIADTREWLGEHDVTKAFKRISINGKESTMDDVRKLLVVHRLAGDETLIETLAQQADNAESAVTRWTSVVASAADGPLARLEGLAGNVMQVLGEWTLKDYRELLEEVEQAQQDLAQATNVAEVANKHRRKLADAAEMQRRLDQLQHVAPDVRHRIKVVDERVAHTKQDIDDLQKRIVVLAEDAARSQPALRELRNAQKTLKRNQDNLSAALNRVRTAAAELELEPTRRAAEEAVVGLRRQIDELTKRQLSMDAAPAMRRLLDDVSSMLLEGEARGLAHEIALDDPETELRLSVGQTRAGIATRRTQLEGQPPPPEAREVADQLAEAQERFERLTKLNDFFDAVSRHRRLVAKNEERVDRALSSAKPGALAELKELEKRRRLLDNELLELAADRAVLRQQLANLGADSAEVVASRLRALLTGLGSTPQTLVASIDEARKAEGDAQVKLDQARQRLTGLRREIARVQADVKRAVRSLGREGESRWVAEAVAPESEVSDSMPLEDQLMTLDRVRTRVNWANERLGRLRTQLAAIRAALRGVGRELRGHDAQATEYVHELQEWFGSQFSKWFDSTKVRNELLPEADGQISVDVRQREVRWREKGRERSRPLEAFSSGEQAYAYTRARLAVLNQNTDVPNRLIVLDEFGAFIAHDRLSDLLRDLQQRVKEHPEDQVLVILPLSHDYASEAGRSIFGSDRENLERLAKQVDSHGFALQILSE